MVKRLMGEGTIAELSEDFNLDRSTVKRRLEQARTDGVPDIAREVFINEMLPESMVVLQEALRGDDMKLAVQVALKIVDGLKAMEHPATANPQVHTDSNQVIEESLELWKAKITRKVPNESPLPAIEAQVVPTQDHSQGDSITVKPSDSVGSGDIRGGGLSETQPGRDS